MGHMVIEEYAPRAGGTKYLREREYSMKDGIRKVDYVRYLGKAGSTTTLAEAESRISEYNEELERVGKDNITPEFRKAMAAEYALLDMLVLEQVEAEKGRRLSKIEAGFYNKYSPPNYAALLVMVQQNIDKQYLAGGGLLRIRSELKDEGIDVSTTTIHKYLVNAGIHEKRLFFRERKERPIEEALKQQLRDKEHQIEAAISDREALITKVKDENEKLKWELDRSKKNEAMWRESAHSK